MTRDLACFSCRGDGTGTWCQFCAAPDLDTFGLPHVEGKEGTWIQTWSGNMLWPLSPTADAIEIMDLAVGQSRENRYGKQTIRPYKVAEHAVIVSRLAERFAIAQRLPADLVRMIAREGLMHDCDEGILPDMPRPLKHEPAMNMAQFREAGKRITACVYGKLGIVSTEATHAIIDAIDKRLVLDEVQQVMRKPELYLQRHGHLKPCGVKLECLGEEASLDLFMQRFDDLFPDYGEIDLGTATFLP
jgi:uncharacterized protein